MTDENGNTVISIDQLPGDWGVDSIVATAGEATSNTAIVQWAYDYGSAKAITYVVNNVSSTYLPVITRVAGGSTVTVAPGFVPWSGRTLEVVSSVGGVAMSSTATYVSSAASALSMHTTSALGSSFAVFATNSSNTDGQPNWIYVEP